MLFTIPEQKKIAKFFQCLDELLQPHIITSSVCQETIKITIIRILARLGTNLVDSDRTEPELDDGPSFTTKHFYFL